MRLEHLALALVACLGACIGAPSDAPATASTPAAANDESKPAPLTEDDLRLIAADPKTLTVDDRRARAHALRRKIMQNPDSPSARSLRQVAEAHRAGQIDVQLPGKPSAGPTFSLPGHPRDLGPRVDLGPTAKPRQEPASAPTANER